MSATPTPRPRPWPYSPSLAAADPTEKGYKNTKEGGKGVLGGLVKQGIEAEKEMARRWTARTPHEKPPGAQ